MVSYPIEIAHPTKTWTIIHLSNNTREEGKYIKSVTSKLMDSIASCLFIYTICFMTQSAFMPNVGSHVQFINIFRQPLDIFSGLHPTSSLIVNIFRKWSIFETNLASFILFLFGAELQVIIISIIFYKIPDIY